MEESLHVSAALRTLLLYKRNLKGNSNSTCFDLVSGGKSFSSLRLSFLNCVITVIIFSLKNLHAYTCMHIKCHSNNIVNMPD